MTIRVASTAWMLDVHRQNKKLNRRLHTKALEALDPDGLHVVEVMLIHEHASGQSVAPHYRVRALLKMRDSDTPATAYIDVPIAAFDHLPTVEQVKEAQEVA